MTTQITPPSSPAPNICRRCAHFYMQRGTRIDDGELFCSHGEPRDLVTGEAHPEKLTECFYQRSPMGQCGTEGRLFSPELSAADFKRLFNPTYLTVNSHSLDKTSQQYGVFSSVTPTHYGIDLPDGNAQVSGDVLPGEPGAGIHY